MTKYREILRLSSLGFSQLNIAYSCSVSKKTVNKVLKKAKELDISWPISEIQTDAVLAELFFPSTKSHAVKRLEAACEKALTYTSTPSYKSIKNILTAGQDKSISDEQPTESTQNKYGITRGAGYYGR